MGNIESSLLNIGYLETLSYQQTPLHRLDPRVKLLTTLVFIVAVVSFGKYEITGLVPFLIYPVVLIAVGNLPPGYLAKKILLAAPFAFFIGIFNPVLDRAVLVHLRGLGLLCLHHDPFYPDRQRRLHLNRQHRPQCGLSGPG